MQKIKSDVSNTAITSKEVHAGLEGVTRHTATPWKRDGHFIKASGRIIAEVFLLPEPMLPQTENAEFIVRACNAHDGHAELADDVEDFLLDLDNGLGPNADRLRAALAKVRA